MTTALLGLFLSVCFLLHNMEEYYSFEKFKKFYGKTIGNKFCQKTVFLYALIILTVSVMAICISNYFIGAKSTQFATTIVAISLLLNGMQHCVTSLWERKILPGTISGILLLIPAALFYLILLYQEVSFDIVNIIVWSLLAAILMFSAIHLSLRIGYQIYLYSKRSN